MERGQPRNGINLMVNHDLGKLSTMLRVVRYGEVQSNASGNGGWSAAQVAAITPGYRVGFEPAIPGSAAGNQQVIQTFDAKWITDLDVTYRFSRNLSVSAGVSNLFNVYPTENIRSRIVNGAAFSGSDNVGIFPYSSVSPFGFNGAAYYGKVSWKF
jgi:iron complex outermembrane receptor protein